MVERNPVAHMMDLHMVGKFEYLTTLMQIVLITRQLAYFMLFQQQRTCLIFEGDVSNAFSEAPPPKQGFFIQPDRAFHEWWPAKG